MPSGRLLFWIAAVSLATQLAYKHYEQRLGKS
jgi:hypothetical protein